MGRISVSLVMTCLNDREGVRMFLESLQGQTRKPDEVVVVDGGSTDGTVEVLEGYGGKLKLIIDPTLNIKHHRSPVAAGRNRAIREARGNIIAVTDSGCIFGPDWLEKLAFPLETFDFDVSVGRVNVSGAFGVVMATKPRLEASSRCMAFKKRSWEKVGGYPEIYLTAEDTLFDERLKSQGHSYGMSDATVTWQAPKTWKGFVRQVYRYSKGDGFCKTHLKMQRDKFVKVFCFPLLALNLFKKHPLVETVADLTRVAGYLKGRYDSLHG